MTKTPNVFEITYPNQGNNYMVVTDKGVTGFSKISGITPGTYELKPFVEGGRKPVHILYGQDNSFNTLTLEKGRGASDIWDSLGPLNTLIIVGMSPDKSPAFAYSVSGAVLQKVTLSEFNAGYSSVLIASASIAYREMNVMPLDNISPYQTAASDFMAGAGSVMVAAERTSGISSAAVKNNVVDNMIEMFKEQNRIAEKIEKSEFNEGLKKFTDLAGSVFF